MKAPATAAAVDDRTKMDDGAPGACAKKSAAARSIHINSSAIMHDADIDGKHISCDSKWMRATLRGEDSSFQRPQFSHSSHPIPKPSSMLSAM
jgi:hypothetical protein